MIPVNILLFSQGFGWAAADGVNNRVNLGRISCARAAQAREKPAALRQAIPPRICCDAAYRLHLESFPVPSFPASSAAPRLIKKYPNRRLYDTTASAYVTLAEIKQLVVGNQGLKVLDAKTGEDLTRSILLQIILEEEAAGSPMFSEAVLAGLIRLYGQTMQGFMGPWLEQQLGWMAEWQGKSASPEGWTQLMQAQMKKNTEQMLGAFGLKT
jgi:polyhydroxyalkanoate synthesis repressor PhaR